MSNAVLIRFELLDGTTMWRDFRGLDHGTLCRQAKLDPNRFYFDLPSSARGVGSAISGAGGLGSGRRKVDGYIMMSGRDKPWGKITIGVREGDKFRDDDPWDERDALRLG